MGFHVRNADGEVLFPSFREVHNAYLAGLIDPDDEIREDGTEKWRRARTLPMLKDVPRRRKTELGKQTLLVLALAVAALVALFTLPWYFSLILGFFAAVAAMSSTQASAARKR
jgi:hypothetical protein